MPGLTAFGLSHTAIGLIALIYGFIALVRDKEISPNNRRGQIYLVTTLITAVTALGIFRHGGFGPPHALAVLTLVALAACRRASRTDSRTGRARGAQPSRSKQTKARQTEARQVDARRAVPPSRGSRAGNDRSRRGNPESQ